MKPRVRVTLCRNSTAAKWCHARCRASSEPVAAHWKASPPTSIAVHSPSLSPSCSCTEAALVSPDTRGAGDILRLLKRAAILACSRALRHAGRPPRFYAARHTRQEWRRRPTGLARGPRCARCSRQPSPRASTAATTAAPAPRGCHCHRSARRSGLSPARRCRHSSRQAPPPPSLPTAPSLPKEGAPPLERASLPTCRATLVRVLAPRLPAASGLRTCTATPPRSCRTSERRPAPSRPTESPACSAVRSPSQHAQAGAERA